MSKPKILITDDEKPTRDVMARVLSGSYDCLTAADAEQAMQIITATPDLALLLTDYKMPGDNGVELIKKAKAAGENAKVAVRNSRRDGVESLKKGEKAGDFSEDVRKEGEDEIQKVTDAKIKVIDSLVSAKEKEIMTV